MPEKETIPQETKDAIIAECKRIEYEMTFTSDEIIFESAAKFGYSLASPLLEEKERRIKELEEEIRQIENWDARYQEVSQQKDELEQRVKELEGRVFDVPDEAVEGKVLVDAEKLLAIRDEFAKQDYNEAYHILYSMVCPEFDRVADKVWRPWEDVVNKIQTKGRE